MDRYIGGPVWCARPAGQAKPVLNAYQPADLSMSIEQCQNGQPQPAAAAEAAPYEEAVRRMKAVAAELTAHGMTTYLHDTREWLDLTAWFCPPGDREAELIFDEDGYTEIRYWVHHDAEADEIHRARPARPRRSHRHRRGR